MPPSQNGKKYQFCVCKIGENIEDKAQKPKIGSASYSKGFSHSVAKILRSSSGSNSTSSQNLAHFFEAESEKDMIEWVNSISHTCALHIACGVGPFEEIKHTQNDTPVPEVNNPKEDEDEEEMNLRRMLQAQREQEKKEKKAATLVQSFWKMIRQKKKYQYLLKQKRSFQLIVASYQMYKAKKIFNPMKKQHRYRANVQKEMVSTEQSYINGLNSLSTVFYTPLKTTEIINSANISSIFSNFESILNLHRYLLSELTNRVTGEILPYQCIGDVFIFLVCENKIFLLLYSLNIFYFFPSLLNLNYMLNTLIIMIQQLNFYKNLENQIQNFKSFLLFVVLLYTHNMIYLLIILLENK